VSKQQIVLDYIPTDTFILEIVYEHNVNVLLEYKEGRCINPLTAVNGNVLANRLYRGA
jgi:hypothetical protein